MRKRSGGGLPLGLSYVWQKERERMERMGFGNMQYTKENCELKIISFFAPASEMQWLLLAEIHDFNFCLEKKRHPPSLHFENAIVMP